MPNYQKFKSILKQFIIKRIAEHPSDQPVKYIEFGYEANQGGLFCVFLDSRLDAGPDGTWTIRLEENSMEVPEWTGCSGQFGDEFSVELGVMIKNLAIELRDQGFFDRLPKQDGCEFGVEDMYGNYGWPVWEERGKENLA